MAKFLPQAAFAPSAPSDLELLPLRFERLDDNRYLATNLVGDALLLSAVELRRVAALELTPGDGLYERAFSKLMIARKGQRSQLQLLALRLRSRMAFLRE